MGAGQNMRHHNPGQAAAEADRVQAKALRPNGIEQLVHRFEWNGLRGGVVFAS